ncbi:MAG: hypothetical protein ACL7BU_11735 [Candidatus Phlomobacter fragariae]
MPYISNNAPNFNLIGDGGYISATGHSMPTEFRNPPSPEKSDFCSWMRNFFYYLTRTFGEKLTPSKLNFALDDIFSKSKQWKHEAPFYNGGIEQVGYRSKQIDNTTYIVSSASHDLTNASETENQLSGGRSAAQALHEIKKIYPHQQLKILVPIAQSNKFGFNTRGHFVLLQVDMNAGKIQAAKIHDSKGSLLDTFYNGAAHLTEQLRADEGLSLAKNFAITIKYHGDQSLFNGNDCGRFTAYYADKIIDDNLSNANVVDARVFFNRNFKKHP